MRYLTLVLFAATCLFIAVPAQAQTSSDMEILWQKIKADKKLVVSQAMQLTQAEASGFWPVYDAYQAELDQISMRIGRLINSYAEAYRADTLTNDKAAALMEEALQVEEAEVALKRAYVPKLSAVLSAVKVARYLQIETKIRALVKFDLAGGIPLAR